MVHGVYRTTPESYIKSFTSAVRSHSCAAATSTNRPAAAAEGRHYPRPTSGTCCAHHRRSDSDHVQCIFNSSHRFAKLFSNDVIVVAINSNLRLNRTVSAFATYCKYLTSTSKLTCPSLSTESNVIDAWICSPSVRQSVCQSTHWVQTYGRSLPRPKKTLKFRSTYMYRPSEKSWFY